MEQAFKEQSEVFERLAKACRKTQKLLDEAAKNIIGAEAAEQPDFNFVKEGE